MMRTRRQALGQHFLRSKTTIEKILARVEDEIRDGTIAPRAILEIGPGKLAITKELSALAKKLSLPLFLVERDRQLEETIHEGLSGGAASTELHFMDAATEKLPALLTELESRGLTPVFVASNLPYSASSQILANLCHELRRVTGCVVMVQKELAQRMAAPPGGSDRGALSLLIQSYFEVVRAFDVSPGAFSPPPKVMSSVLALRPLPAPPGLQLTSPRAFEAFCKKLFSGRRKMIRKLVPPACLPLFPKLGINGTERPETLDLTTILELYRGCP